MRRLRLHPGRFRLRARRLSIGQRGRGLRLGFHHFDVFLTHRFLPFRLAVDQPRPQLVCLCLCSGGASFSSSCRLLHREGHRLRLDAAAAEQLLGTGSHGRQLRLRNLQFAAYGAQPLFGFIELLFLVCQLDLFGDQVLGLVVQLRKREDGARRACERKERRERGRKERRERGERETGERRLSPQSELQLTHLSCDELELIILG